MPSQDDCTISTTCWTIGHSTRPLDEFVCLLKAHRIHQLIDVRTIPRSRHNPHFNTEQLSRSLPSRGLQYTHMPHLGGLRQAEKDSVNTGWRNASFRGYADYMQMDQFWEALDELIAVNRSRHTAIMCAEAVPWRCHRSLIADALLTKGWTVRHILSETKSDLHQLTSFAMVRNGELYYPSVNDDLPLFPS